MAWRAGLSGLLLASTGPTDWPQQRSLGERDKRIFLAFGIHPWSVGEQAAVDALEAALQAPLPLPDAVGEIGLDRAVAGPPYPLQRLRFEQQLALAAQHRRPVVLHIVQAHGHALEHLRRQPLEAGGLVHGFSGSREIAGQYLDLGLHLGMGRLLLSPHARRTQEAARQVPLERLLVETDAPAQLDGAHRLPEVIAALAALRGLSPPEVAATTAASALRLYRGGRIAG